MFARAALALALLAACGPSEETKKALDEAVKKQRAAEERAKMAEDTAKDEATAREKAEALAREQAKTLESVTAKLDALEAEQARVAKKERPRLDEQSEHAKTEDERRRELEAERDALDQKRSDRGGRRR